MINPNIEAEQSIIGSALLKPEIIPELAGIVAENDFLIPEYKNIYKQIKALSTENKAIDAVTVIGHMEPSYKPLIVTCIESVPTTANYKEYAQILHEHAMRYYAMETLQELQEALHAGETVQNCQNIAARLCQNLNSTDAGKIVSAKDGFFTLYWSKGKPKEYIETGFLGLDKRLYIEKGDYIIVGGRPSSGKTALTLQMALHMAQKYKVVYFSLETSSGKIYDRAVSTYTQTPFEEIKRGELKDYGKLATYFAPFSSLNFCVVEAAGWTVAQIRAKAIQLQADVIFIDYLSLLKSEGKNLYEKVTNISMELHTMAQRDKIAVVALSQLNRAGTGEPSLTSLRESGQIEQDADAVLLVHCENTEEKNADRKLIVAKNKEGTVGALRLTFHGEVQTFLEITNKYVS